MYLITISPTNKTVKFTNKYFIYTINTVVLFFKMKYMKGQNLINVELFKSTNMNDRYLTESTIGNKISQGKINHIQNYYGLPCIIKLNHNNIIYIFNIKLVQS